MAGCNGLFHDQYHCMEEFQSSTGSVAGCNFVLSAIGQANNRVSILNRLCGRMQPGLLPETSQTLPCFNPQPALWPDATTARPGPTWAPTCFNPQPALWPDATGPVISVPSLNLGFNPQPALWPDATGDSLDDDKCDVKVSILNRLCGRMQPTSVGDFSGTEQFQSSTGSVAGCNPA